MIYIDVDAAVEVPVNTLPLTDDEDFVSREITIAYNQAGMDLVWNFVTPNGTITQTEVTPTTAGDYDWAHIGDAMYKIEIPASGGASINNDTEGVGYFTGVCDGVLPWRSPDIVFRAAALNNLLIEGDGNLLTAAAIAAIRDDILDRILNGNHDTAGTPGGVLQEILKIPRANSDKAGGAAVTRTNTSETPSQVITETIT